MQQDRIMKTKPWLKTKGAVTPEGKAKVKMNALKMNPNIHALLKECNLLMKQQKEIEMSICNSTR